MTMNDELSLANRYPSIWVIPVNSLTTVQAFLIAFIRNKSYQELDKKILNLIYKKTH